MDQAPRKYLDQPLETPDSLLGEGGVISEKGPVLKSYLSQDEGPKGPGLFIPLPSLASKSLPVKVEEAPREGLSSAEGNHQGGEGLTLLPTGTPSSRPPLPTPSPLKGLSRLLAKPPPRQTQPLTSQEYDRQIDEIETAIQQIVSRKLIEVVGNSNMARGKDIIPGEALFGHLGVSEQDGLKIERFCFKLITEEIQNYNRQAIREHLPQLPNPANSRQGIFNFIFRMGKLQPLLDDPGVEEIEVVRPDLVYKIKTTSGLDGERKKRVPIRFKDDNEVLELVRRIASRAGRNVDEANPILDLRLPGGERLNVVIPPVTRHVALTIRKHSTQINNLEEQVKRGTLTRAGANFLAACVKSHLSILVCGPTASGKTCLLNCLASEIYSQDRVVVIEEISELRIGFEGDNPGADVVRDVVTMEARPKNFEGAGEITMGDLVKNSLRQRPNWIVVGEVRGAEAFYMLLGLTSGHAGMCTLHAQSPAEALNRVKMLAGLSLEKPDLYVLSEMVSSAIKIVVHLKHDRPSGRRLVTSIIEVIGPGAEPGKMETREIFSLRKSAKGKGPKLAWTGVKPHYLEALQEAGLDWRRDIMGEEAREQAPQA